MTHHCTRRAVERETRNILTLTRWLHPTLAKAVLKAAYDEACRREKAGRTDMLVKEAVEIKRLQDRLTAIESELTEPAPVRSSGHNHNHGNGYVPPRGGHR